MIEHNTVRMIPVFNDSYNYMVLYLQSGKCDLLDFNVKQNLQDLY